MADIIDGKSYAAGLRERVGRQVASLQSQHDITPGLAVVLVGETREAIMPFTVNGLKISDQRHDRAGRATGRVGLWMIVMLIASLVVAGAATLFIQHSRGLNQQDYFATQFLFRLPFDHLARHVSEARAFGGAEPS